MPFRRPAHRKIAEALASMDAARLYRDGCYFGGGTAIVLQNGEYRQSLDVDFLCADMDGYRRLRATAVEKGVHGFFGDDAETVREFRVDQYGLRCVLRWRGQDIRFEVVREARISLEGAVDPELCVPTLSRTDQFAEKLLANADRCLDRSVAYRDAIDLGFLVFAGDGAIPNEAIAKAERAYGADIAAKLRAALAALADAGTIRVAAETLGMELQAAQMAAAALRRAAIAAWPEILFATFPDATGELP